MAQPLVAHLSNRGPVRFDPDVWTVLSEASEVLEDGASVTITVRASGECGRIVYGVRKADDGVSYAGYLFAQRNTRETDDAWTFRMVNQVASELGASRAAVDCILGLPPTDI